MEALNPLFSSRIYPYLHQFLLENGGILKSGLSSESLFALVFNLCRCAATDLTPGESLTSRYLEELKQRCGSNRQAELVLCLAWVVLMVQEHPSYAITTFTKQLQPLIHHASIYNKARQLAVTIRQHERHIQTDFLITPSDIPVMKVKIEGNPGSGNTYNETTYNIDNVETLAPNATTIVNKHYHFDGIQGTKVQGSWTSQTAKPRPSDEETLETLAEQAEAEDLKPETRRKPTALVDTEVIREEILIWVSKVRPLLADAWKTDYQNIWADILNMQEVKEKVYNPGKQKNTNFNQYLVGNILYYMFDQCGAWSEDKDYNASEVSMLLIGTTEHQLRKELAKFPPEEIKNRLHSYFTKKFNL